MRMTYVSLEPILPFACPLSSLFRSTSACVLLYITIISTAVKQYNWSF